MVAGAADLQQLLPRKCSRRPGQERHLVFRSACGQRCAKCSADMAALTPSAATIVRHNDAQTRMPARDAMSGELFVSPSAGLLNVGGDSNKIHCDSNKPTVGVHFGKQKGFRGGPAPRAWSPVRRFQGRRFTKPSMPFFESLDNSSSR